MIHPSRLCAPLRPFHAEPQYIACAVLLATGHLRDRTKAGKRTRMPHIMTIIITVLPIVAPMNALRAPALPASLSKKPCVYGSSAGRPAGGPAGAAGTGVFSPSRPGDLERREPEECTEGDMVGGKGSFVMPRESRYGGYRGAAVVFYKGGLEPVELAARVYVEVPSGAG